MASLYFTNCPILHKHNYMYVYMNVVNMLSNKTSLGMKRDKTGNVLAQPFNLHTFSSTKLDGSVAQC